MDTAVAVLQISDVAIKAIRLADEFFTTYTRISEKQRRLNRELQTVLQLCKEIKSYVDGQLSPEPGRFKLLHSALRDLKTDVEEFNETVERLRSTNSSAAKVVLYMRKKTDRAEIKDSISGHKQNIMLAFQMLNMPQRTAVETRVAYQELHQQMQNVRQHRRSIHDASTSSSPFENTQSTSDNADLSFYDLAEGAFNDISSSVSLNRGFNHGNSQTIENDPEPDSTPDPGSADKTSTSSSVVDEQSAPSGSFRRIEPNLARDYRHNRDDLTATASDERRRATAVLTEVEQLIKSNKELSQDQRKNLRIAQSNQERAMSKMSYLETRFHICIGTKDRIDCWKSLARLKELNGKPEKAFDDLVNVLGLKLSLGETIDIKLDIVRLLNLPSLRGHEAALGIAHTTYNSAMTWWQRESEGIERVIRCASVLRDLYTTEAGRHAAGTDNSENAASYANLYDRQVIVFQAWNRIRTSHPGFSSYLREFEGSPLAFLASRGHVGTLSNLLIQNPLLNEYTSTSGATALIAAAHEKHENVIRAILESGLQAEQIDVNHVDSFGDSALHSAQIPPSLSFHHNGRRRDWKLIANNITKLLIAGGADMNLPNRLGQLPIHIAAEQGNCSVVDTMLEVREDLLNSVGNGNSTPLHVAIERGRFQMVKLLLEKEADTTIEDEEGNNALKLARITDLSDSRIIKLLQQEQKERDDRERMAMTTDQDEPMRVPPMTTATSPKRQNFVVRIFSRPKTLLR